MGWTDPGESDFFKIKNHVGALALIAVSEYVPNMTTTMGPTQAIRAEVAIVDGAGAPNRWSDVLLFNKKLVPQLKNQVGSTILARIVEGPAKPGQSAPYELAKAMRDDAELANKYVQEFGDVEAKVGDQSASTSGSYAPDNGVQWASQRQQNQPPPQSQPQGLYARSGGSYPTPPAHPQTDEPPF